MDLVKASRFPEAEDMFAGVLDAAKLFPDPGVVETVRRSAEKELNKHRVQVAVAGATDPARRDDVRIAGVGATPPDNAARLLRGGEARVPAWYSLTKQRLSKRLTVDYKRSQVAAVLDDIADETGISIVIDKPVAISRAHTSSLLDLRIGDMPAETVLNIACQRAGVEYVIMERGLVITTAQKAVEYVRLLPEALRHNWALGRVLFPELNPELFASTPLETDAALIAQPERLRLLDVDVPQHLRSGRALVNAVQSMLK